MTAGSPACVPWRRSAWRSARGGGPDELRADFWRELAFRVGLALQAAKDALRRGTPAPTASNRRRADGRRMTLCGLAGGRSYRSVSNNEEAEFTAFFQASWEPCLRAVTVIVGSPELAEDQVAEAFAKAWRSWPKVSRHPAPRAWVVRAALNAGASWWRRRSRELPLAGHDRPIPAGPGDGLEAALLAALRRRPSRQREVIALRIFLDLDTDTIARQLGIEPGTVRMHLSRGIAALRHELILANTTEVDQ
jgi:RNA polymerase sigma factor (sigma-70 family)